MLERRFVAARSRDDLGRASPDVHNEQILADEIARGAEERECRLPFAGNHRQPYAQFVKHAHELPRILRIARCRRGKGYNLDAGMLGRSVLFDDGEEPLHLSGNALHGLGLEHAGRVDPLPQVGDDDLAAQLGKAGIVRIRQEKAARYRADVDSGIPFCLHGLFLVSVVGDDYSTPNSISNTGEYHVSGASTLPGVTALLYVDSSS